MNERRVIITGLAFFVAIITFPFWFNMGKKSLAPEAELTNKAKIAKKCVLTKNMTSEHMKLLDIWRHSVVRNTNRIYVNSEGQEYEMSITNTCLDCHFNKDKFCDKCHNYASVEPYCWDCHIDDPEGGQNEK